MLPSTTQTNCVPPFDCFNHHPHSFLTNNIALDAISDYTRDAVSWMSLFSLLNKFSFLHNLCSVLMLIITLCWCSKWPWISLWLNPILKLDLTHLFITFFPGNIAYLIEPVANILIVEPWHNRRKVLQTVLTMLFTFKMIIHQKCIIPLIIYSALCTWKERSQLIFVIIINPYCTELLWQCIWKISATMGDIVIRQLQSTTI